MTPPNLEPPIRRIARAMLAGHWSQDGLFASGHQLLGQRPRWWKTLVERTFAEFPVVPSFTRLLAFLSADAARLRVGPRLKRLWRSRSFRRSHIPLSPPRMTEPPPAMGSIALPTIPTQSALAEWLGLSPGTLLWFADLAGRNDRQPEGPLRTYRYRWVAKPGGKSRLLEIPKWELKRVQRRILSGILDAIPPHAAAHGFRPGRSIVTNAVPHCAKAAVLRFDLRDFFPSIPAAKAVRIFRTVGYPVLVSRLLAGLCTARLPRRVWDARPHPSPDGSDHAAWLRFAQRHLPQGTPTSPALANLAAFRLDRRLSRLAAVLGADYTRYADDLTFSGSGNLARAAKRIEHRVAVICGAEGFALNHRKTKLMRSGGLQRVAGVVVNVRPNVERAEYDRLKAILTNCVRFGPASQNREHRTQFQAHLAGRVSHVAAVSPQRGAKLKVILDRIAWP